MFWDFGFLHQKHRVGGTLGCVRRDGSDGWRSPVPRGDNTGASCSTTSANHPVSVPPTGPELPERFLLFWDGTSVHSTRDIAASFLTRCRGSRLLRPRLFGLVSPTLRRRASHAEERLRHQRFLHAGERLRHQRLSHAGVRLRYQRLSDHQSTPACHGETAGITFQLSP